MKKVVSSEKAAKGAAEIMQEKLAALKEMSAKQLVEHAKKEFSIELPLGNGRPWIYKKVAYLTQEKITGNKGKAAEKAKNLDTPEEIEKLKKQAEKEVVKKVKSESKPKGLGVDEHGFRKGSMASGMFASLLQGCTKADLIKIGGKEVNNFLAAVKKPVGEVPAAREAVIITMDNGQMKIKSFKHKS